MHLRVAARGSKLSRLQVEEVLARIAPILGLDSWELVPVKTLGDTVWDRPIHELGGQGAFTREVDRAVLDGRADVAVHSLKDMPSTLHPELEIAYVAPRPSPRDAVITREGPPVEPWSLPEGARVGTSSLRRRSLLDTHAPHVEPVNLRGNLDTRLRKLREGCCHAIILAEAGLLRLGYKGPYKPLPVSLWPASPGQGFIAVVAKKGSDVAERLKRAIDPGVRAEYTAERSFLEELGAGCRTPVAGTATLVDGVLRMVAAVWLDGEMRMATGKAEPREAEALGRRLARLLR